MKVIISAIGGLILVMNTCTTRAQVESQPEKKIEIKKKTRMVKVKKDNDQMVKKSVKVEK